MNGAARIKGALFVVFAMFLLSARCGAEALPATVMVGEVAGYGDYTLQAGFYETFRDILEESLIASERLQPVMRRPSAEDAAKFSLVHMDAIARGYQYRREMAGAALIRYADAAYGRQDEEKAKEWRKQKNEPYALGPKAAETARLLGLRYGAE